MIDARVPRRHNVFILTMSDSNHLVIIAGHVTTIIDTRITSGETTVIILISNSAMTDPGLRVCTIVDAVAFTVIAGTPTQIGLYNPAMSRMTATRLSTVAHHHKTAGDPVVLAAVDRPTCTSRPHNRRTATIDVF